MSEVTKNEDTGIKGRMKSDNAVRYFIIFIGLVILTIVLKELGHIFIPFVIAYFFYFMFTPLNNFLKKLKIPLFISTILDIIIILGVTYGAGSFIIRSLAQFADNLDKYVDKIDRIVSDAAYSLGVTDPEFRNFSIEKAFSELDLGSIAGSIVVPSIDLFGSILIILFFFVFIASGHKGIYEAFKRRYARKYKDDPGISESGLSEEDLNKAEKKKEKKGFPILGRKKKRKEEIPAGIEGTFISIQNQIQKYVTTKTLLNAGAGVSGGFILYLMGIDFPIVWGLFIFILNFIPTFGSAIALILPALITMLQFESIGMALIVVAVLAGLQTVFFNIMEPFLLGKRLNLNPIVILLAVLIWGYLWGIIGMFLAVPLTAIIKIILSNFPGDNAIFISDLIDNE